MMYNTNEARETARKSIAKMHRILANIPLKVVDLGDIQTMHHLLEIMDGELRREIKENKSEDEQADIIHASSPSPKHELVPMPGADKLEDLKREYTH